MYLNKLYVSFYCFGRTSLTHFVKNLNELFHSVTQAEPKTAISLLRNSQFNQKLSQLQWNGKNNFLIYRSLDLDIVLNLLREDEHCCNVHCEVMIVVLELNLVTIIKATISDKTS